MTTCVWTILPTPRHSVHGNLGALRWFQRLSIFTICHGVGVGHRAPKPCDSSAHDQFIWRFDDEAATLDRKYCERPIVSSRLNSLAAEALLRAVRRRRKSLNGRYPTTSPSASVDTLCPGDCPAVTTRLTSKA